MATASKKWTRWSAIQSAGLLALSVFMAVSRERSRSEHSSLAERSEALSERIERLETATLELRLSLETVPTAEVIEIDRPPRVDLSPLDLPKRRAEKIK